MYIFPKYDIPDVIVLTYKPQKELRRIRRKDKILGNIVMGFIKKDILASVAYAVYTILIFLAWVLFASSYESH